MAYRNARGRVHAPHQLGTISRSLANSMVSSIIHALTPSCRWFSSSLCPLLVVLVTALIPGVSAQGEKYTIRFKKKPNRYKYLTRDFNNFSKTRKLLKKYYNIL